MTWTAAEREAIEEALADQIGEALLPEERLSVEGASSAAEVTTRWTLEGGRERLVLEARVDPKETGLDLEQARDLAIDALDLLLLEWLESGRRTRFSGVFELRELQGRSLWVRVERTFPDLEAQAAALLQRDGHEPDA